MKKTLTTTLLVLLMAGCSSTPTGEGAPVTDPNAVKPVDATRGTTDGYVKGDPLTDPAHPLYKSLQARSIFFDYDSDVIKPEFQPVVEAHARFLRDFPNRKVLVQGNTDDRGSREYNIALGQRRADAIKSRLTLLGAKATQVESASLGEEKPRCSEATESCYAQNRRGDLAY